MPRSWDHPLAQVVGLSHLALCVARDIAGCLRRFGLCARDGFMLGARGAHARRARVSKTLCLMGLRLRDHGEDSDSVFCKRSPARARGIVHCVFSPAQARGGNQFAFCNIPSARARNNMIHLVCFRSRGHRGEIIVYFVCFLPRAPGDHFRGLRSPRAAKLGIPN